MAGRVGAYAFWSILASKTTSCFSFLLHSRCAGKTCLCNSPAFSTVHHFYLGIDSINFVEALPKVGLILLRRFFTWHRLVIMARTSLDASAKIITLSCIILLPKDGYLEPFCTRQMSRMYSLKIPLGSAETRCQQYALDSCSRIKLQCVSLHS